MVRPRGDTVRTALTTILALLSLTACSGPAPADDKPVDSGEDTEPVGCDDKWYVDVDGDGFGDARYFVTGCEPPGDEVADGTDCDDTNAAAWPGAPEDCGDAFDANCDGSIGFEDADRDGTAACEDCDDADATVHPGAAEFCDGVDDDCDGTVDETPADGRFYYEDADGDGAGDLATALRACEAPDGWGTDFTDCDDTDAAVFPDALEACNGHDDDCDGSTDESEAYDAFTFYDDDDADGYGDDTTRTRACTAPADSVDIGGDCADDDAAVNPSATEVCNDLDDDCDSTVDVAAVDPTTWFADRDDDGWGDAASTTAACDVPAGYVADAGDCDDTDATAAPDADETCDGTDDDCDGTVDEDDAVDAPTWYVDADTDGFGDRARSARACAAPVGYVAPGTDCDDADAARS
ncbi:MAG: MopE-related protein, partial [Myxococcota bacterium]